jgi:hypothetical protein
LAYFILLSDVRKPKYDSAQQVEWVPFDANEYCWDKTALDKTEFEALASKWPKDEPVPFDPAACDHVQFSYTFKGNLAGVGFNPTKHPPLFGLLVKRAQGRLRHEEFDYARARHVHLWEPSALDLEALVLAQSRALPALRAISPDLAGAMEHGQSVQVRFLCRHESFEAPISLWSEM